MIEELQNKAVQAVADLGERGRRQRIPDPVRDVVMEFADAARSRGTSWGTISELTGLSLSVLTRWRRERSGNSGQLLPVTVSSSDSAGITLVTPSGFRAEGLSEQQAVRILQALR